MNLTPTPKNDQAPNAWTRADNVAPATALVLYSLHEHVVKVERVSVGWAGEGCKAIETTIALTCDRCLKSASATEEGVSEKLQTNITTTDIYVFC